MKLMLTATVGIVGLAWCATTEAGVTASTRQTGPSWNLDRSQVWPVDQKKQRPDGGIVNERSTGNEPFTGPGASGGPTHSAPGATESTVQQKQQQSRAMEQGSSHEKSGGTSGKAEGQGGQGKSSGGSGASKSGGH